VTILNNQGDALEAERIAVKARKITRDRVSAKEGTSTHKIRSAKLIGTAYCVIDKPMRSVRDAHR